MKNNKKEHFKMTGITNPLAGFMNKRKNENRTSLLIDHVETKIEEMEETEQLQETQVPCSLTQSALRVQETCRKFEEKLETQVTQVTLKPNKQDHSCFICSGSKEIKKIKNDNPFIILSCNHICHINCIVDYYINNNYVIVDRAFLESMKCLCCSQQLEIEDVHHIYNKYNKNISNNINEQNNQISVLDLQLSKIKEEMCTLLENKQKLEQKKERSKQIIMTINNYM
jgi:hypothetical protein